ncbi:MAG: hypothetical protein IAE65_08085 [Ignavibacteria bacterium]|nr:hypothetical protein [Ignavibacteria bacterium]
MEIKKLETKDLPDFRNLIEIFKDVFDNDCEIPDDEYLKKLLSNKEQILHHETPERDRFTRIITITQI